MGVAIALLGWLVVWPVGRFVRFGLVGFDLVFCLVAVDTRFWLGLISLWVGLLWLL